MEPGHEPKQSGSMGMNTDQNLLGQIVSNFLMRLWNFRFSQFPDFLGSHKEMEKNEHLGHGIGHKKQSGFLTLFCLQSCLSSEGNGLVCQKTHIKLQPFISQREDKIHFNCFEHFKQDQLRLWQLRNLCWFSSLKNFEQIILFLEAHFVYKMRYRRIYLMWLL